MLPESNDQPKFTDYPVNLFEESRDHANQWDVSALWQSKLELPAPEEIKPVRAEQA